VIVGGDEIIQDALLTGDPYLAPQPTVTELGLLDELELAVEGIEVIDREALASATGKILSRTDIEVPGISTSDFVAPIIRAAKNTEPVGAYLARQ